MRLNIIIFFLFAFFSAKSQIISGFVLDSLTQKPVFNAVVTNIATKESVNTGYNGYFQIKSKTSAVIKISHIAYKNKTLRIPSNAKNIRIFITPENKKIEKIVITTDRLSETPEQSVIFTNSFSSEEIKKFLTPSSLQDLIKNNSLINVQNPLGIYDNSPIITVVGAGNIPGRTLVTFDGVKLNKADDGNVNWNMLPPSVVENVQTTPDALSFIYGSSGMTGGINFSSADPVNEGFGALFRSFYGTYNTMGGEFVPQFKHAGEKGFYVSLDAFAQKSDGYVTTPDSLQLSDIEYFPAFMTEAKINLKLGYDINRNQKIEIIANFFDDKRSSGEKINEPEGSFVKHTSYFGLLKYRAKFNKTSLGVNFYAYNENYFKNIESIKKGQYSLIYTNSLRQDAETDIFLSHTIRDIFTTTTGVSVCYGNVYGVDEYQTSTDKVINSGQLLNTFVYLNNTIKLLKNKNLNISTAVNGSFIKTLNPVFEIKNPTQATDFMEDYTGSFESNTLNQITYSAGIRYNYKKISFLTSYNKGYKNPEIEDLTRSGFMRYGFKIANPMLKPEISENYSASLIFSTNNLNISINSNYKLGKNYMYYVQTGDFLFDGKKPVVQKQNITEVTILNTNASIEYNLNKIGFFANASYTDANISKFDSIPELVGKQLTYTPEHIANGGIWFKINNIQASVSARYTGKQYIDDNNTKMINPFFTIDAKLKILLTENFSMSLSVQNALNYRYIVYYDQLSLGRFMLFNINYKF